MPGAPDRRPGAARPASAGAHMGRLAAIVLLLLSPALQASQRVELAENARAEIEFTQHLEGSPPSGWLPVLLRIVNRAPVAREWHVEFTIDNGPANAMLGAWSLPVPATETREFQLLLPQPWFASSGNYAQVHGILSGPGVRNGRIFVERNFSGGNQTPYTGMSQTLATENWGRLQSELSPGSTGGGTASMTHELAGSRLDPASVPADWRSFSGFATIWLHRDDWIALSGAHRRALRQWVAQGGHLYLAGSGAGLEDLPRLSDTSTVGSGVWRSARIGFGTISRIPLEGEGEASRGATATGPRLPIADVADIVRRTDDNSPGLAELTSEIETTPAERELGTIRPGGVWLGLLIAAIAILLGPVNFFVLAPARRRARLFITVPLISLTGAITLVGLILLQDGTGGTGQRGVLVALQPDQPEALVLQEQCALTGLLMNRVFSLPEETTLIDYTNDVVANQFRTTNYRGPRSDLDRSGPQARGDWFASRTAHAHHLRAFVPTRATLTLTSAPDGTLSVVSTCPGVLRDVVVVDGANRKWWAAEVPPGQKVALAPPGVGVRDPWQDLLVRFGVSLERAGKSELGPLSFHASADSWDESIPIPTLPSVRWKHDVILVTGPVREGKP